VRAPTIAGYTRGTTVSGRETRCTGASGRRAEHVETVGTTAAVVGAALVDVNRACWSGEARPGAIARVGVTIVDTGSSVVARTACTGGVWARNSAHVAEISKSCSTAPHIEVHILNPEEPAIMT